MEVFTFLELYGGIARIGFAKLRERANCKYQRRQSETTAGYHRISLGSWGCL
jgi:hypothetical protein